ncbi:MAG: group I intron-associated PD-(D/E)XK endonuclease, partial [Actinomycetota bacterium]|nr:group I intron-associated PD-(D/E)XK endonuclease [Actinomycetota bacterium]
FKTCSNTRNLPKNYHGEVDFFGVYSPELDAVYLVPIDQVPERMGSLRLHPARNGQAKGLRWASDYVLDVATREDVTPALP